MFYHQMKHQEESIFDELNGVIYILLVFKSFEKAEILLRWSEYKYSNSFSFRASVSKHMRCTLGVAASHADVLKNSWRVPPQCPKNICVGDCPRGEFTKKFYRFRLPEAQSCTLFLYIPVKSDSPFKYLLLRTLHTHSKPLEWSW